MLGQIRLAERRGLLVGKKMGRVQTDAVEVLVLDDALRRVEEASALLPRRHDDEGGMVVEEVTEDNFEDDGPAVWKMPEMDPADALAVMASMGGGGVLTMEEVDED